ncbi:MAG TPA: glycosyltransferase [Vicinamibacteria bacterium]|jgi:glycosyltransferase involved in cell wall biosynthesis
MTVGDGRVTVLYVIWSLQAGGAERVVADLARGLDRARFRALVCCLDFKGRLAEGLEADGIPVFALDKRGRGDARVLFRLVRLMRREGVQVVHTHLWTASFWGRLAAAVAGVPVVVVTEHNLDVWRGPLRTLADRLLARGTDAFVFVSRPVEAFYRARLGRHGARGVVVHNGVDLAPFARPPGAAEARARLGLPPAARVAGVVGRLEERKGHRFFLEAMARVVAADADAMGLVVGEGSQAEALRAQHGALALGDRVRLLGYRPDLAETLAAVDVFVLPSLMEGHPLAILEAMAAGKAVVATAVGGNGEAVEDGVTGVLVPPADAGALADAVGALLRDPARAARLGQEGRRRVEARFSLSAAVRANEELYLGHAGREARRGAA